MEGGLAPWFWIFPAITVCLGTWQARCLCVPSIVFTLPLTHTAHTTHTHAPHAPHAQVYRWQEKQEMIRYRKERLLEPTVDLPPHLTYTATCHSPRSMRPNHLTRTTARHATRQG
jgi:hypothetical protein